MNTARTLFEDIQLEPSVASDSRSAKLRVALADRSPQYMHSVLTLLAFPDNVDLIGRATTIEDAVQLTVNHAPDLLLVELEMELANLLISAVVLSISSSIRIVGICGDRTASLDFPPALDAFIHRSRFALELPSLIRTLIGATHALDRPERRNSPDWSLT